MPKDMTRARVEKNTRKLRDLARQEERTRKLFEREVSIEAFWDPTNIPRKL